MPHGETRKSAPARDISADWWMLFQSPRIDALIKHAFNTHPDFESAQAALRHADAYTSAQQGFFYPAPGAENSPSGIQADARPSGAKYNGPTHYDFRVAQLTVGYVRDVFGIDGNLVEGAQKQAEMHQMQLVASDLTLASNVVAAAIQEAALRAGIEAQLKIVSMNQQALEIVRKQFKLGYVAETEVTQQEMTCALAQQTLVPLQQQLEQTRNLLSALVGTTQDMEPDETFTLDALRLQQKMPVSLPSGFVEQRPDVRMAEAQLRYTGARYSVPVAHMLPQFAVTGASGGMASSPKWMIKSGGRFF